MGESTASAPAYRVEPPSSAPDARAPAPAAGEKPKRRVAVFVAHGMGQQIPFQTLDQVAQGLLNQDAKPERSAPVAKVVKVDGQLLNRLELTLTGPEGAVEAHVYEGYWAPLTEGKIDARGVIRFLFGAGRNGIAVGGGQFKRWLFGELRRFPTPSRIILYLVLALATLGSLVAMNSTIAVVSAGRALLTTKPPAWLTDGLFLDLTTTFRAVITSMFAFALVLLVSRALRRAASGNGWTATVVGSVRGAWAWVSATVFALVLFVVVLGGLSIGFLFYGHVKASAGPGDQLWRHIFAPGLVDTFNSRFDVAAIALVAIAAVVFLLWQLVRIGRAVVSDLKGDRPRATVIVTAAVLVLVALASWLALAFLRILNTPAAEGALKLLGGGLAWILLVVASAFVRRVAVQYLGDVAIYVTPYELDAFFQLRDQIKECVYKVARAVYQVKGDDGERYERVLLVGHSLGSVVVYDVLNRLVNEDELTDRPLNVVARTPLLLTFGSPLDKTAFLFALHGKKTTEAREALAASAQPLLQGYQFRPDHWINIWSPADIISGTLDFYDPPAEKPHPKRVDNVPDPDATTLLAAHVEYWSNPLLFEKLHHQIVKSGGPSDETPPPPAVVQPPQ